MAAHQLRAVCLLNHGTDLCSAGFTSGAALVIAAGQLKYVFGVSYKKQDTLQGELGSVIAQLSAGNFKWQEFVMVRSLQLHAIPW